MQSLQLDETYPYKETVSDEIPQDSGCQFCVAKIMV